MENYPRTPLTISSSTFEQTFLYACPDSSRTILGWRRPDRREAHLDINASSSSEICVLPEHTTTKRSRTARAHVDEALWKGGWVTGWRCAPIFSFIAVGTSRRWSQRYRGMRNILATNLVCGTQMILFISWTCTWAPLLNHDPVLLNNRKFKWSFLVSALGKERVLRCRSEPSFHNVLQLCFVWSNWAATN